MASAIVSSCGQYRYRLDREVQPHGKVFAWFGVNPSTADADVDDATTRLWSGFTLRNGGSRYIAANPFAFRSTNVKALARSGDPVGPENARHLAEIIAEADVLVPCWGARRKVPRRLHTGLDALGALLLASGRPVLCIGVAQSGDPLHPIMQSYERALRPWPGRA